MPYLDGFVAAAPSARKEDYIAYAQKFWPIMKDHGALAMWECWGDDVPEGELTSFPMAVKAQEGEVVVFAWTLWPDKDTRQSAWEKLESDPRMAEMHEMPFDGKRMIFGGFSTVLTLGDMSGGAA